jgi:two-component sensor histidine kinase
VTPAPALSADAVLDLVRDPIFVIETSGLVVKANRAAVEAAGRPILGEMLSDLVDTPASDVAAFIRRCTGTGSQVIGALEVPGPDGTSRRLRAYGGRLVDGHGTVLVGIRLSPPNASEFALLSRKIDELNAEIHQRRRAQGVLEDALAKNRALLSELHHRVKNNVQFMLGMLAARRREPGSADVHEFVDAASNRLLAIGTAQQLLYADQDVPSVPAAEFVTRIAEVAAEAAGSGIRLTVTAAEGRLPNDRAFPVALILNELVGNAARHGARGRGAVRVDFSRDGDRAVLIVADDGPGLPPGAASSDRRSSGLFMVRGLCRQIGADVAFASGDSGGSVVTVAFALPSGGGS